MSDEKTERPENDETAIDESGRPDAEELPDGSSSDGSESTEGEDVASGGGADDE